MNKRLSFYKLIAGVVFIYIVYVWINSLMIDPGAETFRSHKEGLERELKPRIWVPVMYVHAGFACLAMVSGLINFSKRIYKEHRKFHRVNGYVYVASVAVVILTSGYMAPYATGGKISSVGFNLLNMIWMVWTTIALVHIWKKRIAQHRRWMVRGYAFLFTNMSIHLFTFVLHDWRGMPYETGYTIGLYGSIALLILIPELLLRAVKPN